MKFMKKRLTGKEKGFTLIELLVVIAILGILAAVIVPNVSRFIGSGKKESGLTELENVQTAVTAMMFDQELTTVTATVGAVATNVMTAFPVGNVLYNDAAHGNYVQKAATKYYYSVEVDGTVHGWWTATMTHVQGTTGEIGVETAP